VRQFVSRNSPKRIGPDFCAGRTVFDFHRSMVRRTRGNKKRGECSRTKTVVAGEDRHNRASGCFAGGGAHADSRIRSPQLFGLHRRRHRRRDQRCLAFSACPAARNAGSCELLRHPHAAALPPPDAAPRASPLLINRTAVSRSFSVVALLFRRCVCFVRLSVASGACRPFGGGGWCAHRKELSFHDFQGARRKGALPLPNFGERKPRRCETLLLRGRGSPADARHCCSFFLVRRSAPPAPTDSRRGARSPERAPLLVSPPCVSVPAPRLRRGGRGRKKYGRHCRA
jgi:hypothetical protein